MLDDIMDGMIPLGPQRVPPDPVMKEDRTTAIDQTTALSTNSSDRLKGLSHVNVDDINAHILGRDICSAALP